MTLRTVELRSDTFTRPTEEMRRAMYEAEVGDDVWDEDPTVDRLEERVAELMGKQAGLFVSSGTQGNLVGLLAHTRPGDEVILGAESHIFQYESAGTAVVGGLQLRTLPNGDGWLEPAEVRAAIRDSSDTHNPRTGAVSLENTHNRCGGTTLTRRQTEEVADVAHEAGIPVHLDGARLFNASIALGVPVRELSSPVESVSVSLTKGLGAPVGAVLSGSTEYIGRARRWRKMLGGGMRQVGVLAAAGLVALNNVDRLAEDHAHARLLADGLAAIPGVVVDRKRVETNIVFFDITGTNVPPERFVSRLREAGVRLAGHTPRFRALTSYEVSRADIEYALDVCARALASPAPVGA